METRRRGRLMTKRRQQHQFGGNVRRTSGNVSGVPDGKRFKNVWVGTCVRLRFLVLPCKTTLWPGFRPAIATSVKRRCNVDTRTWRELVRARNVSLYLTSIKYQSLATCTSCTATFKPFELVMFCNTIFHIHIYFNLLYFICVCITYNIIVV